MPSPERGEVPEIGPRIVPSVEVVGGAAAARDVCPAPGRSHRARSSPLRVVNLVQGTTAAGEHKGAAASVHRLGTACGGSGRSPDGNTVRRRKAPRVQRNAFLFAGVRARRPYPFGQPLRRIQGGDGRGSDQHARPVRTRRPIRRRCFSTLQRERTADRRHEVSETEQGLGQSSRASDRSGRCWCEAIVIVTSPWPAKPRLACVLARRIGKTEPSRMQPFAARARYRKAPGSGETPCHGRPWLGPAKLGRTAVVLVDRIDCRSRRAARGPSSPRAKSSRTTRAGLAPGRESDEGVKKRRKPDRRRRSRETGGGLSSKQRRAKAPAGEHSSMEGALVRESRSH
jgi:hypothetical protein